MFRLIRVMRTRVGALRDDSAAVLPLFALMMVLLIGVAAFATDMGWLFLNKTRVRRAAESAALSAVVELPMSTANASSVALTVAAQNGYTAGGTSVVTPVPQPDGFETRMQVTITDQVPTFFLSIFGIDSSTVAGTATAEYLPPLPLGSRSNRFGNDPDNGYDTGFWASIQATAHLPREGDVFATSPGSNPEYRPEGYIYGIEATGGSTVTVEIIDGELHRGPVPDPPGRDIEWRNGDSSGTGSSMVTRFRVWNADATPHDLSDASLNTSWNCSPSGNFGVVDPLGPADPFPRTTCSFFAPVTGTYTLQVSHDGSSTTGKNHYSLSVGGGATAFYALNDFAIFNNEPGSSRFDLAEITSSYRGRLLIVDLWDPGDVTDNSPNVIRVLDPGGNQPAGCAAFAAPTDQVERIGFGPIGLTGTCGVSTTGQIYNGRWVRIEVPIPDTYSCASDCWWEIDYQYQNTTGVPEDHTVWSASVDGAPIHLVRER